MSTPISPRLDCYWQALDTIGLEHLQLRRDAAGIHADGQVLLRHDGQPLRVHYRIDCTPDWRPLRLHAADPAQRDEPLALESDGEGHWHDGAGQSSPEFDGCLDVDLMATPFTNTQAIGRLELAVGGSAEIDVLWVTIPGLTPKRMRQRYTRLGPGPDGERYRYLSVASGYTADLVLSDDGLVKVYPEVWRRL